MGSEKTRLDPFRESLTGGPRGDYRAIDLGGGLTDEEVLMPAETMKTEGLEVVAHRWRVDGESPWFYADGDSPVGGGPRCRLIRLSDAQAAIERAREEGIREALAAVEYGIAELEAKARGFVSWDAELCAEAVRALLPAPPPEREPDHLAPGAEGMEPSEEGDR